MSGAFDSMLGSTPFGAGTPLPAGDPPTGYSGLCRFIDGISGDFAIDATTGHLAGMPLLRQRVLLALVTRRGSSTVLPKFGLAYASKITESQLRLMDANARASLYQLTDVEKVMRIDSLTVEQVEGTGRVRLTLSYTDLSTGGTDTLST